MALRDGDVVWDADAVNRLTALWYATPPLSTAEIGRRLGLSKSAVTGKVHRLGLIPRKSPIQARRPPAGPRRSPRATLPALPSSPDAAEVMLPSLRRVGSSHQCGVFTRAAARTPRATLDVGVASPGASAPAPDAFRPAAEPFRPRVVQVRPGPAHACCWPMGDPGTREFRFCEALSVDGRPYCAAHCEQAYVRPFAARSVAA